MKETKIAKKNVERKKEFDESLYIGYCTEHKQTCQRWLEFLEKKLPNIERASPTGQLLVDLQITDLKQAIKLYEDAGI